MKENSGASLFGPDQSKWPIWAVDAARLIEQERILQENAKYDAEQDERDD